MQTPFFYLLYDVNKTAVTETRTKANIAMTFAGEYGIEKI